jgi:hypothetical protein
MKNSLRFAFLLVLFAPALAWGQAGFDGTWKVDLSKVQFPSKPDEFLLQNGMYQCKTCEPPINIKADGQDQPVSGSPYFDAMAVKVIDNNSIGITQKKDGKAVMTGTATVSPDGGTITLDFVNSGLPAGGPVSGKFEETRVAKAPAGSNAISGSWRPTKMESMDANALIFTFKLEGDTLNYSTPTGQSYTAKLDGTDAPYTGDPGTTNVSVKRLDKNTLEETDKRDGKVVSVSRMTLAPDGKSLNISSEDKQQGTTTTFTAVRQ